jgi:hypothetical protein
MRIKRSCSIAVVAFFALAAPVHAQRTSGVTLNIGIAYGNLSTSLSDDANEHVSGSGGAVSAVIALGWTLNEQWRIGLQFDQVDVVDYLVSQFGSGTEAIASFYTASVQFYPSRRGNFWLRANAGLARVEYDRSSGNAGATAPTVGLGLGYDVHIGKTPFAAVPFVSYLSMFNTGDLGGAYSGLGVHGSVGLLEAGVSLGFGN